MIANFYRYAGDLIGLPTDENHLNFRWDKPDCKILFSVTRIGDAASCHLASDKRGLRHLKDAVNEFGNFVFDLFPWCKMIIAKNISLPSVERLIYSCGFRKVAEVDGKTAYVKVRRREPWAE